jgi:hypothetical protein
VDRDSIFQFLNYVVRFNKQSYWLANTGIYTTPDTGKTWSVLGSVFPSTLEGLQKTPIAGPFFGKDSNHLVVMLQDKFIESMDRGANWHYLCATPYWIWDMYACAFAGYDPIHDMLYFSTRHYGGAHGWVYNRIFKIALGRWTDTKAEKPALASPASFGLSLTGSNPFNGSVALQYRMVSSGALRLSVYDMNGRLAKTLASGKAAAGIHTCIWDGRDARGKKAVAGVYLVKFQANGCTRTVKVVTER